MNAPNSPVETLGHVLEKRMMAELNAQPLKEFDELLDLKNLAGESTGYVRTFTGDKLTKGTSVSIDLMPGARYFNIHIIPEPQYDVPRFLFEGMLTTQGSQVSLDLFPDFDVVANIDKYLENYAAAAEIYEQARLDERFTLAPSRLLHMRAFSSPVFLLVFSIPEEHLRGIEAYAERYFDAWKEMRKNAARLSNTEAAVRQTLRKQIGNTIIQRDPDRHMVVKVYGEETTRMIEKANIF